MRCRNRPRLGTAIRTLAVTGGLAVMASWPLGAHAGAYVFAGETNGLDIIAHPAGYTGGGGVLEVEVCIDADAADAAAMETPVQNVLKEINGLTPATPNLFFGADNNIPPGMADFESLSLHEIGHCIGLGHPNLGVQDGVSGLDTNFTASGEGADGFAFNAGGDSVVGSSDDQRDDDPNLHWFEAGVNHPFQEVANPQGGSYTRDLAGLPGGHDYVANAGRDVAALLGFANTEAAMQQGQFFDEDQRRLQADDVATLRMAMTGLDETAGTGDDYTLLMVYGGVRQDTSGCDIVIESQTTGLGVCSSSGVFLNANHLGIIRSTYRYNANVNFFFNPVAVCTAQDDDLSFSNRVHTDTQSHQACQAISYGPAYIVGPGGRITATAPTVTLGPGTIITGRFSVKSQVP